MNLSRVPREPFTWFLLLGVLVFALDRTTGERHELDIIIDQAMRDRLSATWQASYERAPEPFELQGLIDNYLEEEMLYREAKALGLDRHDEIVRRRLAQKIRFLHEDSSRILITEQNLRDWFEAHQADYKHPVRLSFRQVFVDPERHGDGLETRLEALAGQLQASRGSNELPQGDPLLLPHAFEQTTPARVSDQFGSDFAVQLEDIPAGQWAGPLKSAYGLHFVLLEQRTPAFTPEFDELRPELERDYARFLRKEENSAYIAGLREKYRVIEQAE